MLASRKGSGLYAPTPSSITCLTNRSEALFTAVPRRNVFLEICYQHAQNAPHGTCALRLRHRILRKVGPRAEGLYLPVLRTVGTPPTFIIRALALRGSPLVEYGLFTELPRRMEFSEVRSEQDHGCHRGRHTIASTSYLTSYATTEDGPAPLCYPRHRPLSLAEDSGRALEPRRRLGPGQRPSRGKDRPALHPCRRPGSSGAYTPPSTLRTARPLGGPAPPAPQSSRP